MVSLSPKKAHTRGKIGPCEELFGISHHISSPSHPCSTAPEQASSTSSSSPSRAEAGAACCQCTMHVENAAVPSTGAIFHSMLGASPAATPVKLHQLTPPEIEGNLSFLRPISL